LRMEVARDGIAVALVEPGGFKTGIWEETEREVAKREGSRYDPAYRRTLSTTRLHCSTRVAPSSRSMATISTPVLRTHQRN